MVKSGNSLGKRIRNARLKQWKSQAELAEAVGLSQQLLSALEGDRSQPPADVLVKIANELALPEAELLALSGRLRQYAVGYLKRHPSFWTLIHTIAQRQLNDAELAQVTALVKTLGPQTRTGRQEEPDATTDATERPNDAD